MDAGAVRQREPRGVDLVQPVVVTVRALTAAARQPIEAGAEHQLVPRVLRPGQPADLHVPVVLGAGLRHARVARLVDVARHWRRVPPAGHAELQPAVRVDAEQTFVGAVEEGPAGDVVVHAADLDLRGPLDVYVQVRTRAKALHGLELSGLERPHAD